MQRFKWFCEYDYWQRVLIFLFSWSAEQYIEINFPSVFSDPPSYSNIINGKGIFSSRLHAESIVNI